MNYIEHLLILICTFIVPVSISAFASLVGITIGITSSAIGLQVCVIVAGIENCKSVIKKKKWKHDKIVLLAKSKLNGRELLISEALIDLDITHDEFVLINNVLTEFHDMKEEIKNSNDTFKLYIKQFFLIFLSVEKVQKVITKN